MCISALFRYPVKSMQGERLETTTVGPHGIVGDRQWGLLDLDTGLMLTARREPALLMSSARLLAGPGGHDAEIEPEVQIELPDGTIATDDAALSAWLGRRVELRRADPHTAGTYEIALSGIEPDEINQGVEDEDVAPWVQWTGPRGSFHDSTKAHVSLVAEGSMRSWNWRRFRTNVVVTGRDGAEDGLVGEHLNIGSAAFDVRKPIDRCVMTTRPQPGGIERDLSVLTTINAERATLLAIGMLVTQTGTLDVGDDVRVAATTDSVRSIDDVAI